MNCLSCIAVRTALSIRGVCRGGDDGQMNEEWDMVGTVLFILAVLLNLIEFIKR